eukprot:gnl/Chilomastix_caulleri/440.p1 GENE.gnl/Chilomastix_caulleri/440~~gnl/Chilomastix_caulleri/440.p1  ORF type:complete len:250 (+),score=87.35 gnl/Chilomastix_caulleri/440:711-1460(+)
MIKSSSLLMASVNTLLPAKDFDDEFTGLEIEHVHEAMTEYTANILGCFGNVIKKYLPALAPLDIETICTAHGVVWRSKEGVAYALKQYQDFAEGKHLKKKVLIVCDTMYGSTETMARAIEAGVLSVGAECKSISAANRGVTEIAREAFDAAAIAVGSPALNRGTLPTIAGSVTYIGNLDLVKGKSIGTFGSYGWSPMGITGLQTTLESFGGSKVSEPIVQNWKCDDAVLEKCYDLGRKLGEKALLAGQN